MDEIAHRTKTSKRMIYYYFESKEGLYRRVLERVYAHARSMEGELELNQLPPVEALKKLIIHRFNYNKAHEDFIRLVTIENIHNAQYLKKSSIITQVNFPALQIIEDICQRGIKEGLFKPNLHPKDILWALSSMTFFNVSNHATYSTLFGEEIFTPAGQDRLRDMMLDMVLSIALKTNE